MDYTKLFYWLVVADNARQFFWFFAIVFTIISIISTIVYFIIAEAETDSEDKKQSKKNDLLKVRKWIWWSYPFMSLFWAGIVFTPSKKDSLLIVAGGGTLNFLSTDKTAKQIPSELSNFVLTEIKNLAKDAQVDLNIKSQKEKILEEAKNLSSQELLDKMKQDSSYVKILLNK